MWEVILQIKDNFANFEFNSTSKTVSKAKIVLKCKIFNIEYTKHKNQFSIKQKSILV